MADDFNTLDDIFCDEPVKNARVVGKFRPKPKFQPKKKVSAKSSVASSDAVKNVQSTPHDSSEPTQTAKPLGQSSIVMPNDNIKQTGRTIDSAPIELSQPSKNAEQLEHGLDVTPNDISDLLAKSAEENADVLIGSEVRTDFLHHTNKEGVAPDAPNAENIGGRPGTLVVSSIDDSSNTCMVDGAPKDSGLAAEVDALAADDPIVSSADVHDATDSRPVIEEMNVMDSINMTESTTISGPRTGNPLSQQDLKMQNNMYEASDSTSCSLDLQANLRQTDSAEYNLIPTFQNDNAFDLSSPGFTHTFPTESTIELPLNEESVNLMEVPEIPAKLASRRAKTGTSKTNAASDPHCQQQKVSTSSHENGAGRSLRPRKRDTNICGLVDEDGDETIASGEFSKERPSSSAIYEENINNEQPQAESESQKKSLKRNSKKTENDKEKPPKKSKKGKEASEQEMPAKKKRFSHSTKRRRVDPSLLNIPEEEYDPSVLPLRDLILLAEHREKQQKKAGQTTAGAPPATQQSTGYSYYNNDPAGQYSNDPAGQYNDDGEENPIAEDTSEYFNYQSRMDKTPRVRWSKQDTELFYGAVQQFGTDFSMIAQLFPGRVREQIRNKYKKEERQQPLRLREALSNRSKDLCYFKEVIDNLNKISAEQEELDEQEDMEDLTNTEKPDEEVSNADDDEGKHEHVDEEEKGNVANGFSEVQSTEMADVEEEDDEDELFLLSQYKSER